MQLLVGERGSDRQVLGRSPFHCQARRRRATPIRVRLQGAVGMPVDAIHVAAIPAL